MDKTKSVAGTVFQISDKFMAILGANRLIYHVDYSKKHLVRFKNKTVTLGQIVWVTVKAESMDHEVIDLHYEEEAKILHLVENKEAIAV